MTKRRRPRQVIGHEQAVIDSTTASCRWPVLTHDWSSARARGITAKAGAGRSAAPGNPGGAENAEEARKPRRGGRRATERDSGETAGKQAEGSRENPAAGTKAEGTQAEAERDGSPFPRELPVLPLHGTVAYPFAIVPLRIGKERSVRLIDDAMRGDRLIALVAQRDPEIDEARPADLYGMGTVARILQLVRATEGGLMVAVQGIERVKTLEFVSEEPYLRAKVTVVPERFRTGIELEALQRRMVDLFQKLVALADYISDELGPAVAEVRDARQLTYLVAANVRLDLPVRQEMLEIDDVEDKLRRLIVLVQREIEVLEIGRRIQSEATQTMEKAQREYFLREQLRAIRRELGEEEEGAEVDELKQGIEKAGMPEEARREADREVDRLAAIPAISPERSMIRNYLDWLVALPWSESGGGEIDVNRARRVLDEDHYDIEKVKERILEYLAVRKFTKERHGHEAGEVTAEVGPRTEALREPILCFLGPPGVGKTSLGQSIARALDRQFIRMSLGGVRDEAEIRGHRRTYIGALPGRIIQSIRRAGTNDPVFMLDEIDKLAVSFQGDPAAALLEVLDPAQNHAFVDLYLGVTFDLSKVMFITTGNTLETIPPALRDRMEIINLAGYTEEEKVKIAQRYLIPKQVRANGLRREEIDFEAGAVRRIVRDYTREAGVRSLEREIGAVCRKVAMQLAEGKAGPFVITADSLPDHLGPQRFFEEVLERTDRPGIAIGVAWTPFGGDIIFVEATVMPGQQNRLILTGQLGDVMRESAQAALSYLRSAPAMLGLAPAHFENKDIHIHVPAGAIPKDGPSAGVALLVALASAFTGRTVTPDVAMTGEVTLRGKILPVGGIKEKVLAAHRTGVRTVILPRRNERDLLDVPEELRKELRFVLVDTVEEVLPVALPGLTPAQREREAGLEG